MPLTPADVARFPRPGLDGPTRLAFSPDGRTLTWLWSPRGDLVVELWARDLQTGETRRLVGPDDIGGGTDEARLSQEEALRRERARQREVGVSRYAWAGDAILVIAGGDAWLWRAGQLRLLAQGVTDAALTPDARRLVLVRAGDLYAQDTEDGAVVRLTELAGPGQTAGLAEYIAAEEMSRHEGFWISRDGAWVAFAHTDERAVPELAIPRLAGPPGAVEHHRYPFTGATNATVRLGVVAVTGGPVRWMDLGAYEYLCRVDWTPDGQLLVQTQPRVQDRLWLLRVDPATGRSVRLMEEVQAPWINLHHDLSVLPDGDLIWASERTGLKQLYRCDPSGQVRFALTDGPLPVDRVLTVSPDAVWYLAGGARPVDRSLYRAPLRGGPVRRIGAERGFVDAVFGQGGRWVEIREGLDLPPQVDLHGAGASVPLHRSRTASPLPAPELLALTARDGATLWGALFRPTTPPPWPLVVWVYGGPHVQTVQDAWSVTVDLRAQYLAERGVAVLKLDNRGSARRGIAFEGAIAGRTGHVEVDDQVDGVRALIAKGWVDPARVAVSGWSYGGYMALMCLARAPEVFRAAVSGAPVTEWEGYDTHYTERYLGLPQDNPDGYRDSSVLSWVSGIRGRLLIVHGLIDENVHFRHSARLIVALQRAGIPHELHLLPDERHMPRALADRAALEARTLGFLIEQVSG